MYDMYALNAVFATFATPSGHTGCDSNETAEKSNRLFFTVTCTILWRVGCPGKVTTVTMRYCYYMQWVINVKESGYTKLT